MSRGMLFIRNETVDFRGGQQIHVSPFESFIRRANDRDLAMRFILPVTERGANFADPRVDAVVSRVGSARGLARGIARTPEIIAAACRVRRRFGYDVVVVRLPEHFSMVLLPLLSLFRFTVIVWLVHDRERVALADRTRRTGVRGRLAGLISRLNGRIERFYLHRVPTVVNGNRLAQRYCGANRGVKVVYSTLIGPEDVRDLGSVAARYGYRRNCVRLIYAGRISVEKGIDSLFDFYDVLCNKASGDGTSVELTLVGKVDRTMQPALDRRLAGMENPGNITVTGFLPRGADLWKAFEDKDFFCLLSLAEGTPRVVPEAHAAGLPVVISPEANADDVVGDPALVLDRANPDRTARAILALHRDKARYLAMRARLQADATGLSLDALQDVFVEMADKAARVLNRP